MSELVLTVGGLVDRLKDLDHSKEVRLGIANDPSHVTEIKLSSVSDRGNFFEISIKIEEE